MAIVIGLSIGLILAGIAMRYFCRAKADLIDRIVYYTGIILIFVGLIFLFSPVIVWINVQLRAMLGTN